MEEDGEAAAEEVGGASKVDLRRHRRRSLDRNFIQSVSDTCARTMACSSWYSDASAEDSAATETGGDSMSRECNVEACTQQGVLRVHSSYLNKI